MVSIYTQMCNSMIVIQNILVKLVYTSVLSILSKKEQIKNSNSKIIIARS